MHIEYHKEYSSRLGRDMEFKVYGHGGKPALAVPCQNGRFYDWENFGMLETLGDYLENGVLQLFTVDTIDAETVSDQAGDPYRRVRRHEAWYDYVIEELLPRVRQINGTGRSLLSTGFSMGAYHAGNFFFRRPDLFDSLIALSGPRTTPTSACSTSGPSSSAWARAPGRTSSWRAPAGWTGCCAPRASTPGWTTGAPTATTTGPGGKSRCATSCPMWWAGPDGTAVFRPRDTLLPAASAAGAFLPFLPIYIHYFLLFLYISSLSRSSPPLPSRPAVTAKAAFRPHKRAFVPESLKGAGPFRYNVTKLEWEVGMAGEHRRL